MTREEAKNILTSVLHTDGAYMDYLDSEDVEAIKFLASDERPHGKWEKYGDKVEAYDVSGIKTWGQKRQCTNCGFIKIYIEDFGIYSICPSCGANMRKRR